MDTKTMGIVLLNFMASLAMKAGDVRKARALELLADMVESGKKVDDHMRQLAVRLRDDNYDWTGAVDRIRLNSEW